MKKLISILALLLICCISRAENPLVSKLATYALMQNLRLSASSVPQAQVLELTPEQGMDFVKVQLIYPDMPNIQLFLRGPQGFLSKNDFSYQALFITSGFFTGASSVRLLGEIPNTVVVGFEYPYSSESIVRDPGKLLQTFRLTAGQIALSLKWMTQQSWANPNRSIAMGVSLGGLFLPTSLHIAQEMNVSLTHTIFGFTGADIKTILQNNLKGQVPDAVADSLILSVPAINTVNDPQLHLPYLKGRFLVVYSEQDQVIPAGTSERLFELLPLPKNKVVLQGPHIDVNQTELIAQTKAAILDWLK